MLSFFLLIIQSSFITFIRLRYNWSLRFVAMECLYTDGDGKVPTSGREAMTAGEWIALNASAGRIPSTAVFEQALEDRAFLPAELAARPTAWTWTKQPTWYCDRYHWDAWNVVDCFADENDAVPWYFGDGNSPWVSDDGKFHFDPSLRSKAEDTLSKLWLCIDSITSNPPFVSGTPQPTKFNYLLLSAAWDSERGAKSLMDDAKGRILEYLGFLNWWSSSISGWDDPLQRWMVDYIKSFKLHDLKKRGVFIDLPRHWLVLNVGHLLAESVPVYYFWQEEMDDYPCFTRLSPTILQAYHNACDMLDKTEVLGDEMVGFKDDIDTIRRYDEFFQLRRKPDHIASPSLSDVPPGATVYICDFEEWSARLLTDSSLIDDYLGRYHFCIERDGTDAYVTIWRWKPQLSNVGSNQRAGQWGAGSSKESCRGDREIRELFKARHAPTGKARFDERGRVTLVSRLGDVCDDDTGSPMETEAHEGERLLPRPQWVPASHPRLTVPTPASPLSAASHWVRSMSASSDFSSSRASSAARNSRGSGERDSLRRSASPDHG